MIENMWYAILESKEVKYKPVGVTRLSEKLVLWRDSKGGLNCIYDKCCHRGASLSLGCVKEEKLECPFHGFLYQADGKVSTIPANGRSHIVDERFKVNSFKVKEKYGFIWLWNGDREDKNIPEIPFFEDLSDGFIYKTFKEVWDVHYSRAAENQLDVMHLPFIHETTIGKGGKTVVNGPVVKWKENRMTFYVDNVFDDGKIKALKPDQIENYESLFRLEFQMPNLWHNIISDKARVFAAFVPIDDGNTMIYLRFYQNFLTLPLLGPLVTSLSNFYNKKILHQDRRVVLTQLPKETKLNMSENLIQGDLPIIEFRKRREVLKTQNAKTNSDLLNDYE